MSVVMAVSRYNTGKTGMVGRYDVRTYVYTYYIKYVGVRFRGVYTTSLLLKSLSLHTLDTFVSRVCMAGRR